MQTFLPYPSFSKSAICLDNQRLNKQITEAWQIYRTLTGVTQGWKNHPAVKQWAGCERFLAIYGASMYIEWKARFFSGKRGGVLDHRAGEAIFEQLGKGEEVVPRWLGTPAYHQSHRAVLLGKNLEWYSQWGWVETPAVRDEQGRWPYIWPEA